jgi:hypothetical protein
MSKLIIPLNNASVEVKFTFTKGYEATWDDPGCSDDCEIHAVVYKGVDIYPIMHEDDIEQLYDYIYNYEPEADV